MALAHQLVVITRENPEENVWLDTERVFLSNLLFQYMKDSLMWVNTRWNGKKTDNRIYRRRFFCHRPKRDRKISTYHEAMGRIVPVFAGRILSDAEE